MKHKGRIFWPKCAVCQYERRNPELKKQIWESKAMDPLGTEDLMAVWHRWADPFPKATIYSHMRRHRNQVTKEIELAAPIEAVPLTAIESQVESDTAHERGLDEIIVKGRQMVRDGQIKITAQALLQAIKTKAEIEKSTKDRRLDAYKMMSGAFSGPTKDDSKG